MILLISACLAYLPIIFLQDSPWCPLDVTGLPQMQMWGSQTLLPKRRPTAILAVSLSRRRPNWWEGIACSHFEEVFVDDARSLALSVKSPEDSSSLKWKFTRKVRWIYTVDSNGFFLRQTKHFFFLSFKANFRLVNPLQTAAHIFHILSIRFILYHQRWIRFT